MLGLIDVGGGNRGAFGAGVMDYFLDNGIVTDYCIGVSAGSANCASYIAGQKGRNLRFYTYYNVSDEAVSLKNRITKHSFLDLDYIFSTVSNEDGVDPLDYHSFVKSPQDFHVVATDAKTGRPVYFDKGDLKENDYRMLSASCNIPGINKEYRIGDAGYYDGGLADPIPLEKAFRDGCDKVIVVLTLPKDYFRDDRRDRKLARLVRSHPEIKQAVINRSSLYNSKLVAALQYEKEGKVLIISPKTKPDMDILGKDTKEINRIYNEGYSNASAATSFI